jgi:Rrf2 family protein
MDIVRRNTDYALRAMLNVARNGVKGPVPTSIISEQEDVSYQLTCKLMQRLQKAKLVKSTMGPKGGFQLSKDASAISLLEIIEAIQGRITLNKCLLGSDSCDRKRKCPVTKELAGLQEQMNDYLGNVTLAQLLRKKTDRTKKRSKQKRKARK